MTHTVGIDIGSGVVKTALFEHTKQKTTWLAKRCERIRKRDNMQLAKAGYDEVLEEAGLKPADVEYVATTGEGENVTFATGHFYSMTTHARGAVYLNPEARAVVDIGALNGRAIYIDGRGKVLSYKMTSSAPRARGSSSRTSRAIWASRSRRSAASRSRPTGLRPVRRSVRFSPRPTSSTWSRAASACRIS